MDTRKLSEEELVDAEVPLPLPPPLLPAPDEPAAEADEPEGCPLRDELEPEEPERTGMAILPDDCAGLGAEEKSSV